METPITRKHMGLVRDLYLFCCFTGLAFIDLYNLKEENIKTFFDDGEWIVIHRQKTGTEADIKLLDYPKQIMEKYRGLCKDGRVFPVPPYRSCLRSLKDWERNAVSPSHFPGMSQGTRSQPRFASPMVYQ